MITWVAGPHRVEGVAGVDHQVHVPLQDGVHSPPVSLLNVNLPLVAPRLRAQPRVAGVPQVRIRNVGDPYDLFPLFTYSIPVEAHDV